MLRSSLRIRIHVAAADVACCVFESITFVFVASLSSLANRRSRVYMELGMHACGRRFGSFLVLRTYLCGHALFQYFSMHRWWSSPHTECSRLRNVGNCERIVRAGRARFSRLLYVK